MARYEFDGYAGISVAGIAVTAFVMSEWRSGGETVRCDSTQTLYKRVALVLVSLGSMTHAANHCGAVSPAPLFSYRRALISSCSHVLMSAVTHVFMFWTCLCYKCDMGRMA